MLVIEVKSIELPACRSLTPTTAGRIWLGLTEFVQNGLQTAAFLQYVFGLVRFGDRHPQFKRITLHIEGV